MNKRTINISKCFCGSTEIELVGIPAGALSGRKASCFIRCKKCSFSVVSHDLSKASSEKLSEFWNHLQRAKSDRTIWHAETEVPATDGVTLVFEHMESLVFGEFVRGTADEWCVSSGGQLIQIKPCSWTTIEIFNKTASNKEAKE